MQNVHITRNGKQIQLTVDEIKAAWAAWDAELREEQLDIYKELKMDVIMIGVLIPVSMEVLWIVIILR